MAQKLLQLLTKSVPRTKTQTPFKFNQCLQDVYEREQTPLSSRSTSVSFGTHSHDSEPAAQKSVDAGSKNLKSSRKRLLTEPSSGHNKDNSQPSPDNVDNTIDHNNQHPVKKSRQTEKNVTQKQTKMNDKKKSPTNLPISDVEPSPNQLQAPVRKPISFDWKKTIPQALVLDFFMKIKDSLKISVWFLPSQMVCLIHLPFLITLTGLSGTE